MQGEFTERLKSARLSNSERQIADKLTQELHRTAFLGGPQLAEECGVSPSSITRFAQKLGYSGFPELKKELERLYRRTTTPYEMFESFLSKAAGESVSQLSIAQDIQNLVNMRGVLDADTLEAAISRIDEARVIYLAAIGSSEICVELLGSFLESLQKRNEKLTDIGISKKLELSDVSSADVLVAFSFQRILREVRDVALYAKENGATTIAVTDSEFSPLAMVCDITLVAPVAGTTFGLSHVASIAMVNLIANCLAARDPDGNLKMLERAREIWNNLPIFCDTS